MLLSGLEAVPPGRQRQLFRNSLPIQDVIEILVGDRHCLLGQRRPASTRSFSSLPTLKKGSRLGLTSTRTPVLGFRPS